MKHLRYFVCVVTVGFGLMPYSATAVDLANGQKLYAECQGCHALKETTIGPRHCWVVGRPAGKVPDFAYSEVMKDSGLTWDEKTLDAFLTSPISYLSGTNMGYAGLYEQKERDDLIAYLKQVSNDPAACDGVDKLLEPAG